TTRDAGRTGPWRQLFRDRGHVMRMASVDRRAQARGLTCSMALACVATVLLPPWAHAQIPVPAAPRVAPVAAAAMTAEQQAIATRFASLDMPNAVATYVNYPALAEGLLPHVQYLWRESTLPERHRALLALRTAWLARSPYLWAHRAAA